MGNLVRVLVAVAVVAISGRVEATVLVNSSLRFQISFLPPVTFLQNAAAVPGAVASSGVSFTEPASIFTGSVMLPTALLTGIPLINGITIGNLANGTKVISQNQAPGPRASKVVRPGGGLGGRGPLAGTAFLNALGLFNLVIPLEAIGSTGRTVEIVNGGSSVTVRGTGWTTGGITINGVTTQFSSVSTVTFNGYDNRNAGGTGVVQLISAFHVTTGSAGNLPGIAIQTLTFASSVPEVGASILLAIGAAAVFLFGWRRGER